MKVDKKKKTNEYIEFNFYKIKYHEFDLLNIMNSILSKLNRNHTELNG